jgi:hypothetical protein
METQEKTREVKYTECVPEERTRTCRVTVYENVTEEVPVEYTVCVPVTTMKEVQVRVCKPVTMVVSCGCCK